MITDEWPCYVKCGFILKDLITNRLKRLDSVYIFVLVVNRKSAESLPFINAFLHESRRVSCGKYSLEEVDDFNYAVCTVCSFPGDYLRSSHEVEMLQLFC